MTARPDWLTTAALLCGAVLVLWLLAIPWTIGDPRSISLLGWSFWTALAGFLCAGTAMRGAAGFAATVGAVFTVLAVLWISSRIGDLWPFVIVCGALLLLGLLGLVSMGLRFAAGHGTLPQALICLSAVEVIVSLFWIAFSWT